MRKIEIHGHRGSRGTHPENTLPSFAEAAAAGADYFELDLQMSVDDEPIVFHDALLSSRNCLDPQGKPMGIPIPLRRLKGMEITKYDCGSIPQKHFPEQRLLPGTRIPTFTEVVRWLTTHPAIRVNVELKMEAMTPEEMPDPERYARKVVDILTSQRVLDRALIQSFDFRTLRAVKRLAPSVRMACLFEEKLDFVAETTAVGAGVVGPHYGLLTRDIVETCHGRGLQVIPWTVNDPADWKAVLEMGVDGIITDYPRRLITYLNG